MGVVSSPSYNQTTRKGMKTLLKYLAAASAMSALVGIAHATPTLTLTDIVNGSTVTIVDGGVGDSNAAAGFVTYGGLLGDWNIVVSAGSSGSPNGTAAGNGGLDLTSQVQTSSSFTNLTGGGTL